MSLEGVLQGAASDPMVQQQAPPHKVSIMSQENIVMQKKEEARRRCEQLRQLSLGGHVQNGMWNNNNNKSVSIVPVQIKNIVKMLKVKKNLRYHILTISSRQLGIGCCSSVTPTFGSRL